MVQGHMALLTDQHCHTRVSPDSQASLYDMAMAEYAAGVRHLCITDHCDTVHWRTLERFPPCRTVARRELEALEAVRDRLPADLHVRLGLELAELQLWPELTEELAGAAWLDLVLGSHHINSRFGDYHEQRYDDPAHCHALWDIYLDNLQWVADRDYYDVMAHIGYFRRYAHRQGVDTALTLDRYGDRVEHLLKTIIRHGRGIELNCSGLRDGCGPFPSEEILRLYRALGGQLVTLGSDAHRPEDAAKCIDEGRQVLLACGFRYVAVYEKHVPFFIPL